MIRPIMPTIMRIGVNIRLLHNVEMWLDHSRKSLKPFFGAPLVKKIIFFLKKPDAFANIKIEILAEIWVVIVSKKCVLPTF